MQDLSQAEKQSGVQGCNRSSSRHQTETRFSLQEFLSVGDRSHDNIRIRCSHSRSRHSLSCDITGVKGDAVVCVFLRTGLQRRCIAHWRRGQNRIGMSVNELLDCYCPLCKVSAAFVASIWTIAGPSPDWDAARSDKQCTDAHT